MPQLYEFHVPATRSHQSLPTFGLVQHLWCTCAGWSASWQRSSTLTCLSCWQVRQCLWRQCLAKWAQRSPLQTCYKYVAKFHRCMPESRSAGQQSQIVCALSQRALTDNSASASCSLETAPLCSPALCQNQGSPEEQVEQYSSFRLVFNKVQELQYLAEIQNKK